MNDGRLEIEAIRQDLDTVRVARNIVLFDELDSTNRYALDAANDKADDDADGLVVLAERQTRGRGRLGRSWVCPRGAGILCTVLLRDLRREIDPNLLALVVPIAVHDAIYDAAGIHSAIKWPNDLIASHGKLAGVLIESATTRTAPSFAVGIGINCLQQRNHFPDALRDGASSLDLETDRPVNRLTVLQALLRKLDAALSRPDEWDASTIRHHWLQRALPLGTRVTLREKANSLTGNMVDIDPTGALVVQLDEGGRLLVPILGSRSVEFGNR